jgi:hypothetical protein
MWGYQNACSTHQTHQTDMKPPHSIPVIVDHDSGRPPLHSIDLVDRIQRIYYVDRIHVESGR